MVHNDTARTGKKRMEQDVNPFTFDYTRSYTAAAFVPYFAQRLSTACVMYGAESILGALKKVRSSRLATAAGATCAASAA